MNPVTADRMRLYRSIKSFQKSYVGVNDVDKKRLVKFSQNLYEMIKDDKRKDYIGLSLDGNVSFATKQQYKYDAVRRSKTTLARYIRRNLRIKNGEVTDVELSRVTDMISAYLININDVKIISGKDITKAYADGFGNPYLFSCMTGKRRSNRIKFYEINPGNIRMAIVPGKARALLWTTDTGKTVLDRIYNNSHLGYSQLCAWAKKNNIFTFGQHKAYLKIIPDKESVKITCRKNGQNALPYLDSLERYYHPIISRILKEEHVVLVPFTYL